MENLKVLTPKQVIELTGIKKATLYKYLSNGTIPDNCILRIGGQIMIKENEFLNFIKQGGNKR